MRNNIRTTIIIFLLTFGLCSRLALAQGGNYKIQPEDVISITVYEHDDLKTKARVSTNGKISFPLLGKVEVAGLTVQEVEDYLTVELERDYLVHADVQVFIEDYHVKQITVLGAVKEPGKYDMNTEKETTILEVIAMAGGFTKVASRNGTRIIRSEGDEEKAIPIRITDITKKGMKDKDIVLESGDVIFVPESFF
ncbi:MAG: polysaccharide export protein [Candidatus Omnitrophica bacterium]|nr:polysaccharide export protein [Candidatus Omnitrophota bacterium]